MGVWLFFGFLALLSAWWLGFVMGVRLSKKYCAENDAADHEGREG